MTQPIARSDSSEDLLAQLTGETKGAMSRLKEKKADPVAQLDVLNRELEKASEIKDEKKRDERMKILTATFKTINEGLETEQVDLSKAVLGLKTLMATMGKDYENLTKKSDAEQALITAAEGRLSKWTAQLEKAKGYWTIFGIRANAVHKAEIEIDDAKAALIETQAQVDGMMRDRLMNADIEASLQTFTTMVEDTIQIMSARKDDIEIQVAEVGKRKASAFETKQKAAEAVQKFDRELNTAEAKLKSEEELLGTMINGSPEHSAQSKKISDLGAEVENIRGRRSTALALFQSKERFATELEIHEKAQIKLRDNQRTWITLLKSDKEERVVTFKSKLEAMKSKADQDVAKNLNTVGTEIDQQNALTMAMIGQASDEAAVQMFKDHPGLMQRLARTAAGQAEANQHIREQYSVILEEWRKKYGIDPLGASFFTYEKKAEDAPEPAGV